MRILAIRGENLASLAEPFGIEFEQEPLRSAGLFAITGETGAGKSTILDALCLALYDKFPRVVAPGGAEGAPDPSGETLSSNDPRAILRRGAGRGFAEADFVARDGRRYRARCDLMRARGKVAGRLQQRTRALWRIDESGERIEALESGVEPVNRRILELTDLTFDQFRRTALLAQGDFDAFLRADAKERADLLEKITGAEIYGVLSRRAYERWDAARKALNVLEDRRKDIGVMTEEERAAVVSESETITTQRAALATEHKEIRAALARFDAFTQAQGKLAQAEAERASAEQALAALAHERQTLADLASVEPLRTPREEVRKARTALAEKQAALATAQEQAETARAAVEALQVKEQAAAELLEKARLEIVHYEPIWTQAGALDARIEAQSQEAEKARAAQAAAASRSKEKCEALAKARADEQTALVAHAAAQSALEALAAAQPLSERWREIDDWLTKRALIAREKGEAATALRKTLEELKRADEMRSAFDLADKSDRDALDTLVTQMRERDEALVALNAPEAQQRADAAARAHELLTAMARCARDNEVAQAKAASAARDLEQLGGEAAALAQKLLALRSERDAQVLQSEEAERLGELADAAAGQQATALRAALKGGEPCPVCGGTDHPFSHSNDAASELVQALRAKRDAARNALSRANAEILTTSEREAKARALHEDAARRLQEAQEAIAGAAREYAARLAQDPHPEAPKEAAGASDKLAALVEKVAGEREGLTKILATAQHLRADIDRLRKAVDERRGAIESRDAARAGADEQARSAGENRARLEQMLSNAAERIESLDRSLAPFLIVCDLAAADLDRDILGARKRLEDAGARYGAALDALEGAEARLQKLVPQIATLSAEAGALAEQENAAVADHSERVAALAVSRAARAQLLGGEPTATHKARIEEKHRQLRAAHEAAREALARAVTQKAASDERAAGALRDVAAADADLLKARAAFAAILAETGREEAAAETLLSIPREEAAAMRAAVDAAHMALKAAETAVAQRRHDLAEAEAAGLPEAPRDALALRDAELAQALDVLASRLGAIQEKLAQDDAARNRAQALSAEIAEAGSTLKIWDEINAAIGSAKGDKFRSFAQSITLEHLVDLANRRLALLSPRYRLERAGEMGSLGLQIVDRDLGDERRSTRSLSGGERFLASLALALALAGLEGRDSFVDTLFIDEGFGALDSATLDVAIDALENLQGQGRKVGVISHVESLQSRIATKICVERRGGGVSAVRLRAPGFAV